MKADCIKAVQAAVGRALTSAEVQGIEARIRRNLQSLARDDRERFLSLSGNARLIEAGQRAAKELVHEANVKKLRVALTLKAYDRLNNYLTDSKTRGLTGLDALERTIAFKADGKGSALSMESRANGIKANAFRQLLDTFEASGAKFFGLFENREGVRAITQEIFGKDSGNALAKKGAEAWRTVTEALRKQFNESGGDIGHLENWGLPQHHSQLKVAKAGREAWIADVLPKLDRSRYFNEDGRAFTDEQLNQFLNHVWETIATGGVNKIEPGTPRGVGMLANRNSEPRQIHFNGPDDYIAYQAKYGNQDLYGLMVSHIGSLSKDISMVETYGPNPNHAYSFFRDKAMQEMMVADPKNAGKIKKEIRHMDNLYDYFAGRTQPVANEFMARTFDTLRNWLIATRLGSAFITSFADEGTLYLTAHINNLPAMQVFKNELASLNPANQMELRMARRAGLAMETLIGEMNRFGQDGLGHSFSSKMGNSTMRLSGLNAITDARKRAFGVTMMDAIGSLTKEHESVKSLDPHDWKILNSKGITENDWQVWRQAEKENWNNTNSTMLTPESIARVSDEALAQAGLTGKDRNQAVHRLLGIVLEEMDMAVVTPGARERAMMGAGLQRGTWKGELTRSFFLFKSFPLSMLTRHWMRGNGLETAGGKAAYIASLFVSTTVFGALSLEVDQLLQGKDPKTLNPYAKGGIRNWTAAMLKGGSLGVYGDFLFSTSSQGGNQSIIGSAAGPVAGMVEEALNLTQGNLVQYAQGKDTHAGAELIRFLKGNTPAGNLWYTKAALDHMIWNQAAEYLSPGYLSAIRSRTRRLYGQDYWWSPESLQPNRLPDLRNIGAS